MRRRAHGAQPTRGGQPHTEGENAAARERMKRLCSRVSWLQRRTRSARPQAAATTRGRRSKNKKEMVALLDQPQRPRTAGQQRERPKKSAELTAETTAGTAPRRSSVADGKTPAGTTTGTARQRDFVDSTLAVRTVVGGSPWSVTAVPPIRTEEVLSRKKSYSTCLEYLQLMTYSHLLCTDVFGKSCAFAVNSTHFHS